MNAPLISQLTARLLRARSRCKRGAREEAFMDETKNKVRETKVNSGIKGTFVVSVLFVSKMPISSNLIEQPAFAGSRFCPVTSLSFSGPLHTPPAPFSSRETARPGVSFVTTFLPSSKWPPCAIFPQFP